MRFSDLAENILHDTVVVAHARVPDGTKAFRGTVVQHVVRASKVDDKDVATKAVGNIVQGAPLKNDDAVVAHADTAVVAHVDKTVAVVAALRTANVAEAMGSKEEVRMVELTPVLICLLSVVAFEDSYYLTSFPQSKSYVRLDGCLYRNGKICSEICISSS